MIAHNKPTVGKLEKKFLNEVFEKNYFSQHFQVKKFEEEFSKYLDLSNENVAAVSNGTTALYLALKVLNPQKKKYFFPFLFVFIFNACGKTGKSKTEAIR